MDKRTLVSELEDQLAALPKGDIEVRGEVREEAVRYLVWFDGNRRYERKLSDGEVPVVEGQLEERRSIEARLQEESRRLIEASDGYRTLVTLGSDLYKAGRNEMGLHPRWLKADLDRYLKSDDPKVCALYGLRRTGKTTVMLQTACELEAELPGSAAYITLTERHEMEDLERDLEKLAAVGVKTVFIDEVTLLSDFWEGANSLADYFARKDMRIVLSGTDSLVFWLMQESELYERCSLLHTTHIPLAEFAELTGKGIEFYIRYGGTLADGDRPFSDGPFGNWEKASRYINTAIADNIQNSLKRYRDEEKLRGLAQAYSKGELTGLINRVVQSMNHEFILSAIKDDFKLADLGQARTALRTRDEGSHRELLRKSAIDPMPITELVMWSLDIKEKRGLTVPLTQDLMDEIARYLLRLDVIVPVTDEEITGAKTERYVLTQPGMRYAFATETRDAVARNEVFSGYSAADKKLILDTIGESAEGRILEDIVLSETIRTASQTQRVFKLSGDYRDEKDGSLKPFEIDMAVVDEKDGEPRISLYEVKHASQADPRQAKHLDNEQVLELIRAQYGEIERQAVLYCGNDRSVEGSQVEFESVEKYLLSLYGKEALAPQLDNNLENQKIQPKLEELPSLIDVIGDPELLEEAENLTAQGASYQEIVNQGRSDSAQGRNENTAKCRLSEKLSDLLGAAARLFSGEKR